MRQGMEPRDLLESLRVHAVVGMDLEGRIRYWNQGAEFLLGYTPQEALGRHISMIFRPDDVEQGLPERELDRALEEGYAEDKRWHRRKDGSLFFAEGNSYTLDSGTDLPRGFVKVMTDGTLRKRAEDELLKSHGLAGLAAELGHEVRNPLMAMVSVLEALQGTDLTPQQQEFWALLSGSLGQTLELVERALELARLGAARLDLETTQFSLRDALADVLVPAGLRAHARGLELVLLVCPEVPAEVVGDAPRLKQILANLLGNALKFTEEGRVIVRVALESTTPEAVALKFTVCDTGPGIPPERQAEVFQPFVQGDASVGRRFGGSGLGLGIAARLAEAMGGRMWLESEPGHGTEVHFTVRLGYAPPEERLREVLRDLHGLEVLSLIASDLRREELAGLLKHLGIPHRALDGADQARALLADPEPPRILVADSSLLDRDLGATRVVALTRSHLERPHDLPGAQALVRAPITQGALVDALRQALGEPPAPAPREIRRLPSDPRLLLAEDEPATRHALSSILQKRGFEVLAVPDGMAALQTWQTGEPSVVVTDLQLPRLDGVALARRIRRAEALQGLGRTTVVVLTGSADEPTRLRCLEAGADEVLVKPVSADQLCGVLERLLGD